MKFGTRLSIFVCSALMLDLVLLTLILRHPQDDLAAGQMIGLFVLITLATCTVSILACYRHFRSGKIGRVIARTANAAFWTAFAFFYLFILFRFIGKTNYSATGWHWLKIVELLEFLVLTPFLIYLILRPPNRQRNGPTDADQSSR
jgi:hypothetical protein